VYPEQSLNKKGFLTIRGCFFDSGVDFNGYDMAKRLHSILKIDACCKWCTLQTDDSAKQNVSGFQGAKETLSRVKR